MIRIRVFSDFCDSTSCKNNFEKICSSTNILNYGLNNSYYITDDENYTHVIIMNSAMPELTIPKENVIGLAFEPREFINLHFHFIEYAKKHIGRYFIGNSINLPNPFVEGFAYMWHSNPERAITNKPKCMSIIVSDKTTAFGHKYRHAFVSKIIELGLPIDIYGNGSDKYNYSRIKGRFRDAEPYEDYMFSICIENYRNSHYISEKAITPLMFNCVPIYWGCENINSYFDEVLPISGVLESDILYIEDILRNPMNYYKPTYTSKNKKTVNLLENLDTLFPQSKILHRQQPPYTLFARLF